MEGRADGQRCTKLVSWCSSPSRRLRGYSVVETTKCSNCRQPTPTNRTSASLTLSVSNSESEMAAHRSEYVREDHPATSIVARRELNLIALDQCGSGWLHAIDAYMRNLRKAKLSQ
jgi:hypothetical protein